MWIVSAPPPTAPRWERGGVGGSAGRIPFVQSCTPSTTGAFNSDMGILGELKNALKLERRFGEVLEAQREALQRLQDLESDHKRLRMEWADHLDYTERAVGRWTKREQVDRKKAKREAEVAPTSREELDRMIRAGLDPHAASS